MPLFLNNIDLNSNELQNAVIQNLASDPGSGAEEGKVYFNTTAKELRVYNGTAWEAVGLNGVTADAAEINILDGATLSTTELNYVDGVTSAIQTQLDAKAPTANASFTGTFSAPSGTITSTMLADGTIVNADINASAAIVDTKLATISTAGKVSNSATTATDANTASAIVARDASGNFTAGTITAALSGNASTATALATTRAIQVSGDVTGTANFDGSAAINIVTTIAANSVALGTDTTGNYVNDITAGTGVTVTHTPGEGSSPTIAIGQAVGTGSNVTFNNVTVSGDLTVSGTTTSINTETLTVDDNIIVLNNNATGAPSANAGIEIERGSSTNVALRWNETDDKWEITTDGSAYKVIATTDDVSAVSVPTLDSVGDVTITSASNGQFLKWNGSAWVNDAIDLGTDTTGNYVSDVTAGTGITVTHTPGEGSSPTVAIASNYVGQNTITTLGTVTTGTWNGTAIGVQYGGTGSTTASASRLALGATVASASATLPQKLAFDIGNNSSTSFVLTHNLNTRDVTVQIAEKAGSYNVVIADVALTTADTVTVTFAAAPTNNQYRAVIIG